MKLTIFNEEQRGAEIIIVDNVKIIYETLENMGFLPFGKQYKDGRDLVDTYRRINTNVFPNLHEYAIVEMI